MMSLVRSVAMGHNGFAYRLMLVPKAILKGMSVLVPYS